MKQVVQNLDSGDIQILEMPLSSLKLGRLLVRNACSLVSIGTERIMVEFAKKNILAKAKARPDLIREVLEKARQEGVLTTLEIVRNRLNQPLALGYSCAGVVIAMSEGIIDFQAGDRVACAGGGYAVHAEVIAVPRNLIVKLSEGVDFESATFTTLGAIALHGLRLGETVAVIG